ncbi:hypothetical protein CURTO8I2_130003 [Curtobacterium sp. 8I-2]|nr:hypothetical protein CURTO8I2_130003 [Curtobacterium sp. 8I-2]
MREHRDADARAHRGQHPVHVAGVAGDPPGAAGGLERVDRHLPADARRLVRDERHGFAGFQGDAVLRHPHHLVGGDPGALGRLPRRLLDEHQVELTGVHPPEQRRRLVHRELEVHLRVQPPEVPQDPGQLGDGEVVRSAEPEPSAGGRAGEVGVGGGVCGEDRPREPRHRVPVVGERDATGVPGDQGACHRGLQTPDVLRHRRLADAEPGAGLREAAGLRHGKERLQQDRIEHRAPRSFARAFELSFEQPSMRAFARSFDIAMD